MRLYLIRHGETDYNVQQIMQGHDEVPLNDKGIAQAAALGRRMADMPLDHIYASDLRRAAMTAGIVAAYTGVAVEWVPAFRERHPGDLAGKAYFEGDCPRFFADHDYHPPNGETVQQFADRVRRAFDALIGKEADRKRHVAVVTHGMVCAAFLRVCLEQHQEEIAAYRWPNASISIFDYDSKDRRWHVDTLGDFSHLEGLDPHPGQAVHVTGA